MTATDVSGAGVVDMLVEGLRELGHDRSLANVRRLTTFAAAALPGVDDASLTVRAGDHYDTVAPTSELPRAVDVLQYRHGGPCVDAVATGGSADSVVHATDLRVDGRWPEFAAAAVERTGVLGMLSFRLAVGRQDPEDTVGSLNLYANKPHAFEPDTIAAGQRLAAYAAVVLAYAAQREKAMNLERALLNSRDIGAAIGIVMSPHLVTRERAFELLRELSQHTNRKLRDIAEDVISTGDLPGVAPTHSPEKRMSRPPISVGRALTGTTYPASRRDLISHVRRHGAQPQVLDQLERLPDRTFADESDLASALRDAQ